MYLNRMTTIVFRAGIAAIFLITVLLSAALTQSNATEESKSTLPSGPQHSPSELLIAGGDLIQVSVYGTDFDKQVRVSDSGEIALPLLGKVRLAGLSVSEAETVVAKQLSQGGYFNDPQVLIFDREYATQGVSVLGEVQKPGIYPLPGTRTLLDAISAAGGTTPKAGNKVSITHRNQAEHPEIVPLSYSADGSTTNNPQIFPGDTVVVSKAGIVYVVGDVRQPSGIVMENSQMTVLQAVAMAQGTNPTAKLNSSKVIRKTPAGPQEIPIHLKKILSAKATDLPLQSGDILFIPSSAVKSAARRSVEAIVQTATGLAIYRPY